MKHDEAIMDRETGGRERRCIVAGEVLPEAKLVRFVTDPDGHIVPDVAAKLPGRGIWVSADRASVDRAVAKNLFAKAAKANVVAGTDLADRTEAQLVKRMAGHLGLARRAGALVAGFDNVARALDGRTPPKVLIAASDGARDGRRKLANAAAARDLDPTILDCLTAAELSLALGRENVIHAALLPGGFAERLAFDAARLRGFRCTETGRTNKSQEGAGPNPAGVERHT